MAEIPDRPDLPEGPSEGPIGGGGPPPIVPGGGGGSPLQATAISRYWGPRRRRMMMAQAMNNEQSPLQLQGYPMGNAQPDMARQYQQFLQSSMVPYMSGAGRWA